MASQPDLERFRLRRFVEHLTDIGEVDIHEAPVALSEISAIIEASPKASLFKDVGPEHFEIVGAVGGSRWRHAVAFGVADERNLAQEFARRMANPQAVVEVPRGEAPVQQVVIAGGDIDLTRLPFHMQHQYDGAPYLSSAIDYAVDPKTGKRNVGCRRLMLRSRTTMLSNLTQISDLKAMFLAAVERGEHLTVNFAVGAHPLDFLAACVRAPVEDEFATVAALRGAPLPMVRAVSNGLLVPADAELVIEGYFDKAGYTEIEGPYGEFLGYYGPAHVDPVFHVTAITHRRDVLHQTVLHGAVRIARTEHAHQCAILTEARIRQVLRSAGIDPVALYAVPSASGLLHARVSVRRDPPGQARGVIAALFGVPFLKHVFVLDEEVDVFADDEVEWAFANRFRADRDLVTAPGQMAFPMDVTTQDRTTTKAGFDLTGPIAKSGVEALTTHAPRIDYAQQFASVEEALKVRPMHFSELMASLGSKDGREIVLALDALRQRGLLTRGRDGEWSLPE